LKKTLSLGGELLRGGSQGENIEPLPIKGAMYVQKRREAGLAVLQEKQQKRQKNTIGTQGVKGKRIGKKLWRGV